jgi:AcrR family transcriptional regulator
MPTKNTTFENIDPEKRQRIMTEATREFADHGFHQASVNRMVNRLGIAKGSLFKYFGNKQGLLEYVFGHAVSMLKAPLKQIRMETQGDELFTRIRRITLAGADFIEAHPHIYRIYLKMLFQENFPMREQFLKKIRATSAKFLHSIVREAMEAGQLREDVDPDMAVYLLDTTVDRFLQSVAVPFLDGDLNLHGADRTTIETRLDSMLDLLRGGLSGTVSHD